MLKKLKVLKIIASSFHPRTVRHKTGLTGSPLGYFAHSQNFTTEKSIIELLKINIDIERNLDPGIDMDVAIISSNSKKWLDGFNFLSEMHNSPIIRGKIICETRENIGYSYGSYNFGFNKFQDQYDYFIFQEDDMICYETNYVKEAIDIWNKTPNCGFVPFIESTRVNKSHRNALGLNKNIRVSCHGGHGMSSRKVLKEVYQKYGMLPHNDEVGQTYLNHLRNGEIMFTYSIRTLGYCFSELPKNKVVVYPAYDHMRNIPPKTYPQKLDLFLYYLYKLLLAKYIYKFLSYFTK